MGQIRLQPAFTHLLLKIKKDSGTTPPFCLQQLPKYPTHQADRRQKPQKDQYLQIGQQHLPAVQRHRSFHSLARAERGRDAWVRAVLGMVVQFVHPPRGRQLLDRARILIGKRRQHINGVFAHIFSETLVGGNFFRLIFIKLGSRTHPRKSARNSV